MPGVVAWIAHLVNIYRLDINTCLLARGKSKYFMVNEFSLGLPEVCIQMQIVCERKEMYPVY